MPLLRNPQQLTNMLCQAKTQHKTSPPFTFNPPNTKPTENSRQAWVLSALLDFKLKLQSLIPMSLLNRIDKSEKTRALSNFISNPCLSEYDFDGSCAWQRGDPIWKGTVPPGLPWALLIRFHFPKSSACKHGGGPGRG